ncbi:PIN/TRAM domain-containing protein [Aminipila terrae]|uniref:PIN domain nuclease n=1 Tax=Aminipila terrae TaxID=2697030 RepID=A0A6P1MDS5_9FIRM|nr:PIN/TRAM domain-containing protein [Aminipila terrae]QHI72800.1 PIN domain nuclease [Aminipila terrae]
MLKKLIRIILTIVGAIVGYGVFLLSEFMYGLSGNSLESKFTETQLAVTALCFAIIFGIIFFRATPSLGKHSIKVAKGIESDLQGVSTNDIASGTFGLIVGLIIAFLVSQIYATIQIFYMGTILSIITYLIMGYLGVIIATKRFKDVTSAWLARSKSGQPFKSKSKLADATPKILDTSVIIDGRIADIMKTGFIEGNIVIPEFVLLELQHIADSSDGLKRNRGRRGLDILNKIQEEYGIDIYNTTSEKSLDEIPEVDVKLLKLAQIMNGKVVTNDFNLNKVAGIKGVKVLNINELANTLKPVVLPGEDMKLFLVKEGKESNQAVAYLDDGTMIVVEEGRRFIGQNVTVTVTSVLQTSAGRMIFAKPKR